MNLSYDFAGQVALVTGAGAGIGLATSKAFAYAGAAVVLADVNEAALEIVTSELRRVDIKHSRSNVTFQTNRRQPLWSNTL